MPRGGARPNSGPKAKPKLPDVADKGFSARVLTRIGKKDWRITDFNKIKDAEDYAIWLLCCGDRGIESANFNRLVEKRDGKAMHTVNHLHDKPIEMNVKLSLGEGMRLAMQKAEERVRSRK